ncbi:MAG: group II truncated hemoglobin [Spongiibacteraceae bacterium]
MTQYESPYQALGSDGIQRLCSAFYNIMDTLPEAAGIRAMHGQDLAPITAKLADYLNDWMGGPPIYSEKYGSVCMTQPHAAYWIGPKERDQWLLCMNKALEEIGVDEEVKAMLKVPLYRVADAVRNRDGDNPTNDSNIIAAD